MCLKRHSEIRGGRDPFVLQTLSVSRPALGAERGRGSVRRLRGMKAITQCFPGVLEPFIWINLSLLSDPRVCGRSPNTSAPLLTPAAHGHTPLMKNSRSAATFHSSIHINMSRVETQVT